MAHVQYVPREHAKQVCAAFLVLLDVYAELIWKPNGKESERVLAKTQGWPRELIFAEYMARKQVSWVYTAFAGAAACWTVVLCWYWNEMPRAVDRY